MPAAKNKNEKILRAVQPNAGIEAIYRKRLRSLIEQMHRSFDYFIKASYRKNQPVLAQDATPAAGLQDAIDDLSKRWESRFAEAAPELAAYFARTAARRSDDALRAILRKGGISVRFKMTAAMRDIMRATIEQNVQLIRSIPEQYLTQVQGSVMRSVQTGRDLGTLSKELQEHYGVTKRRAALIARTQNNMATSSMQRARQTELGIKEAIWLHSTGGKSPRPSHVAQSGKKYNIETGFWDPDEKVFCWPGTLINCRCTSKPIIRGFS